MVQLTLIHTYLSTIYSYCHYYFVIIIIVIVHLLCDDNYVSLLLYWYYHYYDYCLLCVALIIFLAITVITVNPFNVTTIIFNVLAMVGILTSINFNVRFL